MRNLIFWTVAATLLVLCSFTIARAFVCPQHALALGALFTAIGFIASVAQINVGAAASMLTAVATTCLVLERWSTHGELLFVIVGLLGTIIALLGWLVQVDLELRGRTIAFALLVECLVISWVLP